MGIPLMEGLRTHATRFPERVAVVELGADRRAEHSYADCHARALRAASRLRGAGLAPGDRVAICVENGIGYVTAFFGSLYAGACVVPVSILAAPGELAHRLRHARVRALWVDAPRWALARHALGEVGVGTTLLDVGDVTATSDDVSPWEPAPSDAAMLLYTSGTTGSPKAAVLSHASLAQHTAHLVHHHLPLDSRSVVLGALPLSHSFGTRMTLLAPFYAGARTVLMARFDAARSLEAMEQEGVTWLPGVPTMFAAWSRTEGSAPRTLSACLSAGAPLTESVRRAAEARLGAPIRQGYGLTEASFSTLDDSEDSAPGCSGHPVHGVEVRITSEKGEALPAGEVGEIRVRGTNVMSGYLDDPRATAEVIEDGFLHTGDLGRLDEHGRLYVVDRLKDLILRGGYNVVPAEVEAALAHVPGVAEVSVVGRPDPMLGEEIVAVIRPEPDTRLGLADVAACARQRLGRPKQPREVAFVDELPLGKSRKVLRRELRERLARGELETRRVPYPAL